MHQARRAAQALQRLDPALDVELAGIRTAADRDAAAPIDQLGDKSVFVRELEHALLDQRAHIAVHSLKDVPLDLPSGLLIAAYIERADPRDVLVTRGGVPLSELPAGTRAATSSRRRRAQLLALRRDLELLPLRGNVATRLARVDDGTCDAIVLAAAGLARLGLAERGAQTFAVTQMCPAPGQGVIAIEAPVGSPFLALLQAADQRDLRTCAEAEREFARRCGATCRSSLGCFVQPDRLRLRLHAAAASPDGARVLRMEETFSAEEAIPAVRELARRFLGKGAGELI